MVRVIGLDESECDFIVELIHQYKSRGVKLTKSELEMCDSINYAMKG